jgi:hypothetical protein
MFAYLKLSPSLHISALPLGSSSVIEEEAIEGEVIEDEVIEDGYKSLLATSCIEAECPPTSSLILCFYCLQMNKYCK